MLLTWTAVLAPGGERESIWVEKEKFVRASSSERVRGQPSKRQLLSLSQTALCVCSGEDGLGPSLSLFSLLYTNFHSLLFLHPPTIFSSSPCNFRCQQQQQQHAQTWENAFVLFRSPGEGGTPPPPFCRCEKVNFFRLSG